MIFASTDATRRRLPHLETAGKTYFVTFATWNRQLLPEVARDIALDVFVRDHREAYWLHGAVIMPDHVHLVFTPYDGWRLSRIMQRIKGVSSHAVNRALHRRGALWQGESFDRIMRSDDDIRKKCTYLCENPVRGGLVASADEYRWLWREWVEGQRPLLPT